MGNPVPLNLATHTTTAMPVQLPIRLRPNTGSQSSTSIPLAAISVDLDGIHKVAPNRQTEPSDPDMTMGVTVVQDSNSPLTASAPSEPSQPQDAAPVPVAVAPSGPTVDTGHQTHHQLRRPSLSRAELAKQALDAYRAEPVSPPPLATASTTATGSIHKPGPLPRNCERRSRSGDYSLFVPRVYPEFSSPQKLGQSKLILGPSYLSRPPLTTSTLLTPATPAPTGNNECENYPHTPHTKTELTNRAAGEYEYRRVPASPPQSPLWGSPGPPKQVLPTCTAQIVHTLSVAVLPSPQTPRLDIIEETPNLNGEFPVSPTSHKIFLSERLAVRPVRRARAVSDAPPADILKAKLKEQQRKEHLAHGTWQQGRFRPPWDELTVISSGGSVVEDNPEPTRHSFDTISPGLSCGRPESPLRRSIEISLLDSNQGILDMNCRASVDKYNDPRDHREMQEFLEQHLREIDDLPDMTELQALLPHGFPGTLKLYYQLEVLAEHYFDTLQPNMAIYIYRTYFTPPPGTPGVTYLPRAATWFTLGQIYLSTHSFLSALRSFKLAAQCDPFEVASHVQVGYVSFLLERYREAKEAYYSALRGFRDADKINYQVLGLQVVIRKEDVIQSIRACDQVGLGTGVWGIASGKIYRVPEEKKRNIARRKYFDQGKVVGRAVEVGKVGWGGKRKAVQVMEDDYDSDGGGLERIKTQNSSGWNWRSPVTTVSGRARRSLDSARLEGLERVPTLGGTMRGSSDTARSETPKPSTERVEGEKDKSHKTNSGLDYFLGVLGWR